MAINQVLVKLLLLALNLMPLDQAAFNFHVLQDGVYATTYRVERRDQDFTMFRPRGEEADFPAFDAESSRRFGRSYTVRVRETGEITAVVLTDILQDMPPLSTVPRQILKTGEGLPAAQNRTPETRPAEANTENAASGAGDIRLDGVGRTLFLKMDGQSLTVVAEVNAP
ncbi:MAG: hypothetical protein FWG35_02630 [Spirochaetaceae bacterium]|nr:hypothetical protein [Spirochaetaceae bacterium]